VHGLRPHLVRQFKLSNDPQFAAKLKDIVGLYVNPPDHALVLSVDEKSQIQALDRTQPGLPMKKGRAGTMTHDYKRHGVTTLFAALDVLEGRIIGQCMQRHRHQEFIRFLNVIDARTPKKKAVHVIIDNYAAHKHPKVLEWLDNHPRFVFHFTPTSASWLNAVEGFFAQLTKKRLKRGVFRSLQELKNAIHRPRRHQRKPKALYLDQRSQQNHRRRQTRAPSVRFDPLALLWQIFEGAGFPNQFFCDSWVVGILEGRPWILIGRAIWRSGLCRSLARWETRRDRVCAQPMWRD
jgi:transposase